MFVYESKWPQINISFYTSLIFCNWLSRKEGLEPVYKIDKSSKFYKVEWSKISNGAVYKDDRSEKSPSYFHNIDYHKLFEEQK